MLEHYDVVTGEAITGRAPSEPAAKKGVPRKRAETAQRQATQRDGGREDTERRDTWGALKQQAVLTISVGGSREALTLAMETDAEILLIQEHRIAGPGLPGIQGLAMGKGWRGVWDAAQANGNGRSGGTDVLVRRPDQVMRGGG